MERRRAWSRDRARARHSSEPVMATRWGRPQDDFTCPQDVRETTTTTTTTATAATTVGAGANTDLNTDKMPAASVMPGHHHALLARIGGYNNLGRFQGHAASFMDHPTRAEDRDELSGRLGLSPARARPRTLSLPTWEPVTLPASLDLHKQSLLQQQQGRPSVVELLGRNRLRSFSITSKGVVSLGNVLRRHSSQDSGSGGTRTEEENSSSGGSRERGSTTSRESSKSSGTTCSSCSSTVRAYRVLLMGAPDTGKTTLIEQFLANEDVENDDVFFEDSDEDSQEWNVSILVDGEEILLSFVEIQDDQEITSLGEADAFVILYSTVDRESFDSAVDLLYDIRKSDSRHPAVILVATKTDLVRGRRVTVEEGTTMAKRYDCKYTEVSSIIKMNVDHLLVGMVQQIRLSPERDERQRLRMRRRRSAGRDSADKQPLFSRLFRKCSLSSLSSKSCENLLSL